MPLVKGGAGLLSQAQQNHLLGVLVRGEAKKKNGPLAHITSCRQKEEKNNMINLFLSFP